MCNVYYHMGERCRIICCSASGGVVENVRVRGGRVVQRQVLYLGEINDSQPRVY